MDVATSDMSGRADTRSAVGAPTAARAPNDGFSSAAPTAADTQKKDMPDLGSPPRAILSPAGCQQAAGTQGRRDCTSVHGTSHPPHTLHRACMPPRLRLGEALACTSRLALSPPLLRPP
eukprot:scaffold11462_cov140-Isochrysis_galbana.AAC.2